MSTVIRKKKLKASFYGGFLSALSPKQYPFWSASSTMDSNNELAVRLGSSESCGLQDHREVSRTRGGRLSWRSNTRAATRVVARAPYTPREAGECTKKQPGEQQKWWFYWDLVTQVVL